MRKLDVLIFIGMAMLSACQSRTATTAATLIVIPTNTALPTETATPVATPTLEIINGGWSTFHTQEFGFGFQYPAVYDKGFYDPADPLSFCNIQVKKEESKFSIWVGHVRIVVGKTDQSLEEVSDAYIKDKRTDWNILSQAEVSIDSLPAITVEYAHENPDRWGFRTFLIHDDDLLTIDYYEAPFGSCSPLDTGYSSYWVYKRIISTTRFDG